MCGGRNICGGHNICGRWHSFFQGSVKKYVSQFVFLCKSFSFRVCKDQMFFSSFVCSTSWRGWRDSFAFLPPSSSSAAGWDVQLILHSSGRAPVLPPLPQAPLSALPARQLVRYTFESKPDLFNKIGFLGEKCESPSGKEEGEGRKPQNCKFWSTSLKTHTRAQGR